MVALSTTEAKYIAISKAIKEVMRLKGLVSKLLGSDVKAILMRDSQSAIYLLKNQAHHKRTKHIDVRLHFIREIIEKHDVILTKVSGEENAADMFTKAVPFAKLKYCMKILQVILGVDQEGKTL